MSIRIGGADFDIIGRHVSAGQKVVLYFPEDQDGPKDRVVVIFDDRKDLAGYFLDETPFDKAKGQARPVQRKA